MYVYRCMHTSCIHYHCMYYCYVVCVSACTSASLAQQLCEGLFVGGVCVVGCAASPESSNTFYTLYPDKTKLNVGGVFREKNFFTRLNLFALGTTLLEPFSDFGCRL
jgi:hypothetical protein